MSHVIRWSDCNSDPEGLSEAINPLSKIRLFRDYSEEFLSSDNSISTPYWKCAVLGLPNELKEEEFALFVEPYSSEISSFVIVSQHMADLKSPPQNERIKPKIENSSNDVVKSVGQQHPSDESILTSFDSSKIAIVEFVNESSLKEFTNLYNNLHFPNFKNVPPCIVILLKDMVYETENYEYQTNFNKNEEISMSNSSINEDQEKVSKITENRSETKQTTTMSNAGLTKNGENNLNVIQNTVEVVKGTLAIPVGCIELPTCTVCLRRLQCSVSGVDGGNDIPVSIRFYGNTTRCQACRVYGECNESDGSGHNKTNSQLRHCLTCGLWGNIWACLVCAHTGCGRYAMRHAEQHYRETHHSFSLELATGRIWDYGQDNFVHIEGEWGRWRESDFEKDDNEGGRGDLSHATVVGARTSYSQTADTTSSQQASGSEREGERDRNCLNDIDIVKSSVNTSATASSSAFFSGKNDEKQNRYDSYYMSMTADENSKLNNQSRSVRSWDRVDGQTVDKIGCLMESYENLLESQLLDQQIYFEKKLARETILALEESLRRRKCMAAATLDSNRPVGDAIMKNSRRNDGKSCNNNIRSLRNCKSIGNRPTSDDIVMSSNADSVRAGDWISSAPRKKVASNINQSETVNNNHTDDHKIDYDNDNKNNNNNDNHNNNDDNCNDDGDDDYNNNFHNNNHYDNDNDEYNSMSPTDYEAIDEQLARVEISKIEISSLEHEYSIILSNLKDIESENKIMRKNNEILIKEQKKLREHVEQLNNSEEETKRKCEEEVNELEQQIRDLCFYTKMKNQVASSPLRDELEGGSVVMPISTSLPIPPSLLQSQSQSGVQHMAVPQGSKKKSVTIPLKKSK